MSSVYKKQTQSLCGDVMISRIQLYQWHKRFKEDMEDNPRSGRPSTGRTEKKKKWSDHHLTEH